MADDTLTIGDATLELDVREGELRSLGSVQVGSTALRNPKNRFLPWFDTYAGEVFRSFRLEGVGQRGDATVINTRAVSDPDVLFQERRDSSGDACLRTRVWDAEPVEGAMRVALAPASAEIDGHAFTGFRYWFEYEGPVGVHRFADRQTWELGGDLSDTSIHCRNLFDLPCKRLGADVGFSSVGLEKWASLLPGNLWARWSLLPSFDMQTGGAGVFVAWFDEISCIRSVIETLPGEDWVRYVDLHYVAESESIRTNPKTVLYCPDVLDDVEALNLWTRIYDREQEKAWAQLGIRGEEPPRVTISENHWKDFSFEHSYDETLAVGAEFGVDNMFIDPVWEHGEALRQTINDLVPPEQQQGTLLDKLERLNMCCTLDFEVAEILGGEAGLKRLCDKAAAGGIRVISWMATHYHPHSMVLKDKALGHGKGGVIACKESGRHPDTGYPNACWTANLNAPVYERIREQVLGVCERTGLSGFLWDSYSNLGWWQVDYSDGSMRPQWDRMAQLYADLANKGLYIQPEAVVSFSNHSCCGLHGGNVYAGDLLGYSYNTVIGLHYDGRHVANDILTGDVPIDEFFRCYAHKRAVGIAFQRVPREQWDADAAQAIKDTIAMYKAVRPFMHRRTVLHDDRGVLWEGKDGERVLWTFREQPAEEPATDLLSGEAAADSGLAKYRVYRLG